MFRCYKFFDEYKNDPLTPYCHTGLERPKSFFVFYHSRGSEVLRSFDIDTVFDVNAIVSHVLLWVPLLKTFAVAPPTFKNVDISAGGAAVMNLTRWPLNVFLIYFLHKALSSLMKSVMCIHLLSCCAWRAQPNKTVTLWSVIYQCLAFQVRSLYSL